MCNIRYKCVTFTCTLLPVAVVYLIRWMLSNDSLYWGWHFRWKENVFVACVKTTFCCTFLSMGHLDLAPPTVSQPASPTQPSVPLRSVNDPCNTWTGKELARDEVFRPRHWVLLAIRRECSSLLAHSHHSRRCAPYPLPCVTEPDSQWWLALPCLALAHCMHNSNSANLTLTKVLWQDKIKVEHDTANM